MWTLSTRRYLWSSGISGNFNLFVGLLRVFWPVGTSNPLKHAAAASVVISETAKTCRGRFSTSVIEVSQREFCLPYVPGLCCPASSLKTLESIQFKWDLHEIKRIMVTQSTLILGSIAAVVIVGATLYGRKPLRRSLHRFKSQAQTQAKRRSCGVHSFRADSVPKEEAACMWLPWDMSCSQNPQWFIKLWMSSSPRSLMFFAGSCDATILSGAPAGGLHLLPSQYPQAFSHHNSKIIWCLHTFSRPISTRDTLMC